MAPLPTMRVMTPNAPTPYSVTRLYPEISEFFSAPGTGRRAVDQSPETVRGKTIEENFAQDRQQMQETPTVQRNVSTTIDQPQVQVSSLQIQNTTQGSPQAGPSRLEKGKQKEESEDFFAYYDSDSFVLRDIPEEEKINREIDSFVEIPEQSERSPRHRKDTNISHSPPSHASNPRTNSPHSRHSGPPSSSTASSLSIKTAPDEEMIESRPYISTDHTAAMENSADMYYDREWRYPETELQKYKYVFG